MSSKRIVVNGLLAALLAFPFGAYAGTYNLNFSSLSQPGANPTSEGSSLTQQGFTIAGTSLFAWQASSPNLPGLNPADTSLFDFYAGTGDLITAPEDAAFTINSIDLAPLLAGGTGTFDVLFTGTFADSSTVTQTFTVNDSPDDLQTFDFSGFSNVVGVSFTQGTNAGYYEGQETAYQFDNVNVSDSGGATVTPEPSSFLFLASGLAAFASGRLRRKIGRGSLGR
jgi:hypothetical protein